jgi:hypothetical protein
MPNHSVSLAKGINLKVDRMHKCQAVRLAGEYTKAVFLNGSSIDA